MENLVFNASLPSIQSAIQISGDGSARVKFDIPSSEINAILKLPQFTGKSFKLCLVVDEQPDWSQA